MRFRFGLVSAALLVCVGAATAIHQSWRAPLPEPRVATLQELSGIEPDNEAERINAYEVAQASKAAESIVREASRLAQWLTSRGRSDEALRVLLKHLDIAPQVPGGATYVISASRLLSSQGNFAEAERTLRDGIHQCRSQGKEIGWNEIEMLLELGQLLAIHGHLDQADETFSLILERAGESAGPVTLDSTWRGLQLVSERRGDRETALALCLKRHEVAMKGLNSVSLEASARECARLLDATGDERSADLLWERTRARITSISAQNPTAFRETGTRLP